MDFLRSISLWLTVFAGPLLLWGGCSEAGLPSPGRNDSILVNPGLVTLPLIDPASAADAASEETLTIFAADEHGRPYESAHLNVYLGACGGTDGTFGSSHDLVVLKEDTSCTTRNAGFLQCVLPTNGIASFTVSASGVGQGNTPICIESNSGEQSAVATARVLGQLPDETSLALRGLANLSTGSGSFDFAAEKGSGFLACQQESLPSCSAFVREKPFDVVIFGTDDIAPISLPTDFNVSVNLGLVAGDALDGAWLSAAGTCAERTQHLDVTMPHESGTTGPLQLCADAGSGTYTLTARAESVISGLDTNLARNLAMILAPQPARLTWTTTATPLSDGSVDYHIRFALEDCQGNQLPASDLTFSEPIEPSDLQLDGPIVEEGATALDVVAPDGQSRVIEATVAPAGDGCLIGLRDEASP